MNILIACDNEGLLPVIKNIIAGKKFTTHAFTYASTIRSLSAKHRIKYIDIKKDYRRKVIGHYELVLSMHCRQLFPAGLVNSVRCVNIHPGYIPFNRGWYPQVFSIINKKPVGATIHEMDEKIDRGRIIAQEKVSIKCWDNSAVVYDKIIDAEISLLNKYIKRIIDHKYKTTKKGKGNLNTSSDFRQLCHLDMNKQMKLGDAIDLLRALTHPPYSNAFFIDKASGHKIYVGVHLKPADDE